MSRAVLVTTCLAIAAVSFAQVGVRARVNAARVGVEDVLELTVTVEGGRAGEPELPELDGFRVAGRSSASQVSIVGGQITSTMTYTYQLLPEAEGRYTIGPVEVSVGGERHRSEPIDVTVVAGSILPPSPSRSSPFGSSPFSPFGGGRREPPLDPDDVFLRAEVSRPVVYEGEGVVVTYRLYCRHVPLGPEIEDDPPLTGFWVEEIDTRNVSGERVTVNGRELLAFPLKQRILFPTRSGTIEVPSLTLSTAFRLTSQDPFDAIFSRGSRPMLVRSPALALEVRPLPEDGRPRDFSGAVGQYRLSAELNRESVAVGEPVTLTLSVEGEGNLRAVDSPVAEDVPGFRTFPPKSEDAARATSSGLSGSKSWEYVLVPGSGGRKELGPWRLHYFDPEAGRYREARAGPLALDVTGPSATDPVASPPSTARDVTLFDRDIRYLKEPPSSFEGSRNPYHRSSWFLFALALPVVWNLGLLAYVKRKEKEKTHSSLFRSRRAQRMARERLRQAGRLAKEGKKAFYEEIAAALYRYVGDKQSVSASGLTMSAIDEILEDKRVGDAARREMSAVLELCDEARFTPGERTSSEMEALRARAEKLIVRLEKHLG